ncbi:MAG TPA: sensor histidine kinase [Anaerolineales bacterium]
MDAIKSKAKAVNVVGLDPLTRVTAWVIFGLTLLLDAGVIALMISTDFFDWDTGREWGFGGPSQYAQMVILTIEPLVTAGLGMAILFRSANRRMGWLMMGIGCLGSLVGFTELHSAVAFGLQPQAAMPLKWPLAWLVRWIWLLWLTLLAVVMPQIFPTGMPLEGRWRRLFQSSVLYMAAVTVILAFAKMPLSDPSAGLEIANPLGLIPIYGEIIYPAVMFPLLLFAVLGITSLGARFWRSRGDERQQIKWIFYAVAVLVVSYWIFQGLEYMAGEQDSYFWGVLGITLWRLGRFGLPLAIGFSILKYRLYDIDLVINRTLVYGALTAIVASGYVLVVTALGAILPAEGNLLPSLVATGVIAASFAPLREWLQRLINRLMFGERDDPYVVLSRLGQRLMTTPAPEATLHTITQTVATALKFPYAAIRLQQGDEFVTRAEYGTSTAEGIALDLVYQNEVVGQFVVAPRAPGEPLAPRDRQLLEDIAHQASAVAHAVRLTTDLQRSRQRLVTAREDERRRLRRDLHDGLGPTLASHTLKLDTAMDLIHEQPDAAIEQLQDLYKQTQEIVADIRRLVHQLRPPALDDLGLVGAVQAHIQHSRRTGNRLHIAVDALPEELPPLPAAIELAAYRITMEAVTNAIRHARAEHCQVRFHLVNGLKRRLQIQISDNGQGLPRQLRHGVGITSMRERAQELGGWVRIEAGEGGGTLVCAELPLAEENVP